MTKEKNHITFRAIRSDELPALAAMHRQVWQDAYAAIFPEEELQELRQEDFLESWRERMAEGCWSINWVFREGEKTGFVVYGGGQKQGVEIKSFYFLPAYWGKGVAHAVMQELLRQVKTLEVREIFLWVLEENQRAQQFYSRHGFCHTFKTQTRERLGFTIKEVQMSQIL